MLTFGGDHFVSLPLIRAHAKKYGPVALLQFDAHCDTWQDDGMSLDHGTMFARAIAEGIIDVPKSTQVGLRTHNDTDMGFEILTAPWVHKNGIGAALEVACCRAADSPVYVSFDIDGLDNGLCSRHRHTGSRRACQLASAGIYTRFRRIRFNRHGCRGSIAAL